MEHIVFTEEEKRENQQRKEDEEWRNNWPPEMFEKYSHHYVAIRNKRVIASARSLAELDAKLSELDEHRVTIEFIEDPSLVVVYGIF